MLSSTTIGYLRNRLWSGSRHSTCVNSRQHASSHIRFFLLKRGRKSKRNGRSRASVEPSARFFLWTGDGFLQMSHRVEIVSNIQPKKIGLNVRRNGPQPSICVRTFSPITIWAILLERAFHPDLHVVDPTVVFDSLSLGIDLFLIETSGNFILYEFT